MRGRYMAPLRRRRSLSRPALIARVAIVAGAFAVVAASPSAVAGLRPAPTELGPVAANAVIGQVAAPSPSNVAATPPAASEIDPCSLSPELCNESSEEARPLLPTAPASTDVLSCATATATPATDESTGSLSIVSGTSPTPEYHPIRFRVEVEDGLAVDPSCFADAVTTILNDPRGWGIPSTRGFQRVDDLSFDFRLILASPDTTNTLCYPAATGGKYSCRNQEKVVLNMMRWEIGAKYFGSDIETYRHYLVNHEVGHYLGNSHRSCPGAGQPAPVMMQQTKGVGECLPNGWPTKDEG